MSSLKGATAEPQFPDEGHVEESVISTHIVRDFSVGERLCFNIVLGDNKADWAVQTVRASLSGIQLDCSIENPFVMEYRMPHGPGYGHDAVHALKHHLNPATAKAISSHIDPKYWSFLTVIGNIHVPSGKLLVRLLAEARATLAAQGNLVMLPSSPIVDQELGKASVAKKFGFKKVTLGETDWYCALWFWPVVDQAHHRNWYG